jgi:hypothetical protein
MRHFRVGRLAATVVMLGSTLGLAGGTLLATAGPASAASGGTNVCSTLVAGADLSSATLTGTFSDCHQQGTGSLQVGFDVSGAPSTGSIFWATGHATSLITIQLIALDFSGGPCPPASGGGSDVAALVLLTVGGGPYEGSGSIATICADPTTTPITVTNLGPVTI